MFYYEVQGLGNYEDFSKIYSFAKELKKKSLVVVPIRGLLVITAKVIEVVDTFTALYENKNVDEIICELDVSKYASKIERQMQMNQLEEIMESKTDQIKMVENFRKLSEKSPEFKSLYQQYETLLNGGEVKKPSSNTVEGSEED